MTSKTPLLPLDLPAVRRPRRRAFSRRREFEAGEVWDGRTIWPSQRRIISVVDDRITYWDVVAKEQRTCERSTFLKWAALRVVTHDRQLR